MKWPNRDGGAPFGLSSRAVTVPDFPRSCRCHRYPVGSVPRSAETAAVIAAVLR